MAVIIWPLLRFRINYRCGHCVAVCPAGEELKAFYLQDKAAYIRQVLKPLQERAEPVYVISGSKAESAAKRNPQKQVKPV
jgi:ferredoxin